MHNETTQRTQGEVEAAALRLAQAVSDYDRKDDETRRAGDNMRRLNRLDLGEEIWTAPNPQACIAAVVAGSSLTLNEVEDIYATTIFNIDSGAYDWLREIKLSFTQNRALAGVKVKTVKGASLPPVPARLDAVRDSIERNEGRFKEDAEFRQAMRILPPPNSLANIIERAKADPEYAREIEKEGLLLVTTDPQPEPIPDPIQPTIDWFEKGNLMRLAVHRFSDEVFNGEDVPSVLIEDAVLAAEELNGVADLLRGRIQMREVG